MKKLLLLCGLLLLLLCCDLTDREPFASINITEIDQYFYFLSEDSIIFIYYEITNIGEVDIDYYKIDLTAHCSGGVKYFGWTNGLDLRIGETQERVAAISAGEEVCYLIDYEITELTVY